MAADTSSPVAQPNLGKPQFQSHSWLEPIIIVSIMIGSLILNRHRNFRIWGPQNPITLDLVHNSEDHIIRGMAVKASSSSRWRGNIHSRILQKLPFLVEIFYWGINYLFYSVTKATSRYFSPAEIGVVTLAEDHGISILSLEHESVLRLFFPIKESDFQSFFLNGHQATMSLFNRMYSLVHIPGTILFLSWYYYAARDHDSFAIVRRTMTLSNFASFIIFCFYPCMPPRLLPKSYHFHDTVRQEHAESIWTGSKSINQLAAMPSLHFTYAFIIGCTFIYYSGVLQRLHGMKTQKPSVTEMVFVTLAIIYPSLVLSIIIATANHYWLDAVIATLTVALCFLGNRALLLLLPLECSLCWLFRISKPLPTTGNRHHGK